MRWALLGLIACGKATSDTAALDSLCDDSPQTVTWESFGAAFVGQHCQPCHASTAVDRQGAPEDVIFDTEADVLAWEARVLAVAAGDRTTMPPRGGVSEDDRLLLEVWLTCSGGP